MRNWSVPVVVLLVGANAVAQAPWPRQTYESATIDANGSLRIVTDISLG